MLMVAVQSSNVARIGHEGTTLRVEFRDGKLYEWADISYDLYLALLNAPSKGTFVARHLANGRLARMHEVSADQFALQTYDPDSCCGKHLHKAMSAGKLATAESWECPECGCTWKPKQVGDIRHWSPVPLIAVF